MVPNLTCLCDLADGVWSEVSLYHKDDLRYFLNTDETQHRFSTASKKGGSTTQGWGNVSFPRSGERVIENSRHTTGVYTTNAAGEVLPPMYIYDSKAKNEDNMTIDVLATDGLPMGKGYFGHGTERSVPSYVSASDKGGMNGTLWSEFNERVILPQYPNIADTVSAVAFSQFLLIYVQYVYSHIPSAYIR